MKIARSFLRAGMAAGCMLTLGSIAGTAFGFESSGLLTSQTSAPNLTTRPVVSPATDNQETLFATHFYNPAVAASPTPTNMNTGTYFTSLISTQRIGNSWALVNTANTVIDPTQGFQLVAFKPGHANTKVITASASNKMPSSRHVVILDDPRLNGNVNAAVIVQNMATTTVKNNHRLGVYYANNKWNIYNEDMAEIAVGTMFAVLISTSATLVTVPPGTTANHIELTTLPPAIKGKSNAKLLVTHVWNPRNVGGTYFDKPVGVWFNGKWRLYDETQTALPAGVAFNVDWDYGQSTGTNP